MHVAYKALHAAIKPAAVELLFGQVDESVMQSFFRSCMEQARTGVGARHSSLHGEVCFFVFSLANWIHRRLVLMSYRLHGQQLVCLVLVSGHEAGV